MSKLMKLAVLFAGLLDAAPATAQDAPPRPQPQKEHQWLEQLAGDWTVEGECLEPGQPATKFQGTDTGRRVGGFWTTCEFRGEMNGAPFTGAFTVGYEASRKKFVGTSICCMQDHLWQYQGTLDASGKVLTLETEGPCCKEPGKTVRLRDVIEIRSKDQRVTTVQLEKDGKWVTVMTLQFRRKAS